MSYAIVYGFEPRVAATTARDVLDICARQDHAAWNMWFDRFNEVKPAYCASMRTAAPITQLSMHRSTEDLNRDRAPQPDHPEMPWILQEFVRASASKQHRIEMMGFHGTLCDGVNALSRLTTDDARAMYDRWCQMLMTPGPRVPEDLSFLDDPDAHVSYVSNERLRDLLASDSASRCLDMLTSDLASDNDAIGQGIARHLTAWRAFLVEVADAGMDVYQHETAS